MDCDSLEESLVSSISLFFCFFSFLNTEFFNGFAGLGFGVPFLEFAFLILLSSNNYLSKEEKKKKKKKYIYIYIYDLLDTLFALFCNEFAFTAEDEFEDDKTWDDIFELK